MMRTGVLGDGFLGDDGLFSFYNVMRGMTILGFLMLVFFAWRESPWFPWD